MLSIEAAAALAVPGVLAVLTGRDAVADGLGSIPHKPVPTNPNEFPLGGREAGRVLVTPHPPLAADIARFAGEAVAMVIAETAAVAADAAERVRVVYEPLPSVTATPVAGEPGAPILWHELGSNVCVDSVAGDAPPPTPPSRRPPNRAARHVGAPHHRRAHGAARGPRRARRGDRALHALRGRGRSDVGVPGYMLGEVPGECPR